MKRGLKNLTSFGLILVFAAALLCSTLAAPGQSLASVTGCSQNSSAMAMAGCENPSYLCGSGSPADMFSHGVINSARSNDLFKTALSLVVGEVLLPAPEDWALLIDKKLSNPSVIESHKVSIRLFNSILNL